MRIDWQTVGNCVTRSLHDLEPERSKRLDGLVRTGIDETSYRKGRKYITVVVNHDTNTVVWIGNGHGKSVLEQFYKALSNEQLAAENPQKRGRPKTGDKAAAKVKEAREKASELKHSAYSLGKAPENLTKNQKIRLDMIQANDPQLYRAYCLKESLRLLLKSTDARQAEAALKHWLWLASHSRIPAFHDLYEKIRRHKEHILNEYDPAWSEQRKD